ncbi:MAG: Clp protease N-terminal domain-containing protein [Cyanobacteria bacterium P01_G01_bin.39]
MFKNFFDSLKFWKAGKQIEKLLEILEFNSEAVQSIVFAKQESRRLCYPHVGTEQLLLGLLMEEHGIASQVLRRAGVKLDPIKQAIEDYIGYGKDREEQICFTPRTKRVIEIALKQAQKLKQREIGTEHLLLALLREGKGLGIQVLKDLGFDCQTLEQQLRNVIQQQ